MIFCIPESGIPTAVPAWMTEPEAAKVTIGDPQVSVKALCELRRVLDLHISKKAEEGGVGG
jgi:hypothetical protein